MQKAVIYSRISTDETKQDSGRQLADLNELAARKDWEVKGTFSDSISGTISFFDRPEASKMLDFIKSEGINLILVTEFSRLGRNEIDALSLIAFFGENKIGVYEQVSGGYIVELSGLVNTSSKIVSAVKAIFAQSEREQLVQRTTSGVKNAQRKGHWVGQIPKGYTTQNKKLVLHEVDSEIIIDLFNTFLETKTLHQTTKTINSRYGWKLEAPNVKKILKNTVYIGYKVTKTGHTMETPKLIDKTTFEAVQSFLSDRTNRNKDKGRVHTNPLSNVAFCAQCGEPLQLWATGYNTFRCRSYSQSRKGANTSCGGLAVGENVLLSAIIDFCHLVGDSETFLAGRIEELENQVMMFEGEASNKRDVLDKVEKTNKKNKQLFYNDLMKIEELKAETEKNTAKTEQLEKELAQIVSNIANLKATIKRLQIPADKPDMSFDNPAKIKAFIQSNIIKIEVGKANDSALNEFHKLTGIKAVELLKVDVQANTFEDGFYLPKVLGRGQENIYLRQNVNKISVNYGQKEVTITDNYPFWQDKEEVAIYTFKRLL